MKKPIGAALVVSSLLLGSNLQAAQFIRGDVDGNGGLEVTDAVRIFGFLFLNNAAWLGCEDVADTDDNGIVELTDGLYVLSFLFLGGPRPPIPFVRPGFDRTVDDPFACGDVIGGPRRPVTVHVPPSYDGSVPLPLVLLLHGATASGSWQETYMKFLPLARSRGFLYAHPDGTTITAPDDPALGPLSGDFVRGWNAGDDFGALFGHAADDSAYLEAVIEGVKIHYNVDPKRVFIVGHSGGGRMAYRMACHYNDIVAAVATLAGPLLSDPSEVCPPGGSIHVLVINGTEDRWVGYHGGSEIFPAVAGHPGAPAAAEQWAAYSGCSADLERTEERLDLDSSLSGAETRISRYVDGCRPGGSAELWTIEGGGHAPQLLEQGTSEGETTALASAVIDWLLAHPMP